MSTEEKDQVDRAEDAVKLTLYHISKNNWTKARKFAKQANGHLEERDG